MSTGTGTGTGTTAGATGTSGTGAGGPAGAGAAVARAGRAGFSTTLLGFSLRGLLLRGRTAGLAALPLVVAAVAVVVLAVTSVPARYGLQTTLAGDLLVGLVVPIVALVLGTGAFGDEREGGTLPLLRAVVRPRWHVVLARAAAAWVATVVVCLPAVAACAVVGVSIDLPAGEVLAGLLLATTLSAAAYCGLFVLLSLLARRGLLAGLAYVVLWETFLAGLAPALRGLSIGSYARRVVTPATPGDVPLGTVAASGIATSAVVLVAVALVALALASWRLQRMDVGQGGA
ncbi:ABC transporter permease subunit [Kineococcus gypseus]|uniref:ABC transporter permease subunit n=1 Tax=Kineococcus gypseus TaxID=1637102 RepID=UPI003D7D7D89